MAGKGGNDRAAHLSKRLRAVAAMASASLAHDVSVTVDEAGLVRGVSATAGEDCLSSGVPAMEDGGRLAHSGLAVKDETSLVCGEPAVGDGLCLADVGTDHGYVPIFLVEQGACERAIALDVREGPLERAKTHIREHGLAGFIETRLSDGFAALRPGEADVIVLAGMGGISMERILEAGAEVLADGVELVLQPQSELAHLRLFLSKRFALLDEDMVEEDGKYYPMMRMRPLRAGESQAAWSEPELTYGPLLLRKRHPVLREYLQIQLGKNQSLLRQLGQQPETEAREAGIARLCGERELLLAALRNYGDSQ